MTASLLGFARSSSWRLVAAGAYAALAWSLVALIHAPRPHPPAPAAAGPPPTIATTAAASAPVLPGRAHATLTLTATYPVGPWIVQRAGHDLPAQSATSQQWQGRIADGGTEAIFVRADALDPLASGPCAVRAVLQQDDGALTSQILWGAGAVAGQLAVPPQPQAEGR